MQDVTLDLLEKLKCPHCGAAFTGPLPEAFSKILCETCGKQSKVPGKYGQFLLYDTLGESVTSVVFDAFDPKLGRNVTLKILNYVLSKNPELVDAFKNEALAAAALNSTYVLKVYEFGIHNRQPFMVMEHIEGRFLNEVLQQEKLTEFRILEIMDGIVQGLQDMHNRGILHGDVMPRNILIHTDGSPRISDFGLARFNAESDQETPRKQWESWSSPYFMPPERIEGKQEDHRGDFYSLGTTLFNMLTGELPFFDMDENKVLEQKITMDPPDPRTINADISDGMAELTGLLMQRDPEDRPLDYEDLRALLSELKSQAPKPERRIPEPDAPIDYHQQASPQKKEPIAWFVFLVLLAILIAMVISIPHRSKKMDPPPVVASPTPVPPPPTPSPSPIPTSTPTPPPVQTPTPLPLSSPTPAPISVTSPLSPSEMEGIEVYLIPPSPSDSSPQKLERWENHLNNQVIFTQINENQQPEIENLAGQPPRIRFSESHLHTALLPQRRETFTLISYIQIDAKADHSLPMFIMGIDPFSENERRISILTEPHLPYSVRFETEKGSALLTLPLEERDKPFFIAFRRGPDGDYAFLGNRSAELSSSPPQPKTIEKNRFPGFQLGGLEDEESNFKGWMGDFMIFNRNVEDKEIQFLADHLYEKYGRTP